VLSKLFKSRVKFDDPDPGARRRAVLDIPDADAGQLQNELAEVAASDTDLAVRRAAVGRITQIELLKRLLTDSHPEVADGAAEGLAREATLAADPKLLDIPQVRIAAIRHARDLDHVAPIIGDVEYDADLIKLAVESKNAKVRLAVADKLQREASLAELERVSRHRDKNVHRLARHRLDEIKQARTNLAKSERRAIELAEALEAQLRIETDALFAARLGVIKQDWATNERRIVELTAQLASHGISVRATDHAPRFEAAVERADEAAARVAARVAPAPAPTPEPAAPPQLSPDQASEFDRILKDLGGLFAELRGGKRDPIAALADVRQRTSDLKDHWLATADHAPPPAAAADRFHQLTHSFHEMFDALGRLAEREDERSALTAMQPPEREPDTPEDFQGLWTEQRRARQGVERLERLERAIGWPAELPRPAPLEEVVVRREALLAFDQRCHERHESLCARLRELIDKLSTEVDGGHLANAVSLEGDGKRLLKSLPAGSAKRVQQEFNALSVRVLELKDWRTFATHPKREELCREIETLAETPMEAPLQAARIKQLREEWKELGQATNHHDRKLLDRFNRAAERAFEPCRTYFEEQAQRRKFNLEQRIAICEQLETYLTRTDWSKPDWRAAENIQRVARNEWRNFHPVDRSPGRKVEVRFEKLTEQLHEKIKSEWDRNVAAKQAIIDEAAALQASGQEPRDIANQLKGLQKRWQQIGITPRRVDQRLWQSFRTICDQVFGSRDEARAVRQQTLESSTARAAAICDELQHAIEDTTADTASLEALRAFSDRFHGIADLPRDAARRLDARFRDLERAYRALLREGERRSVLTTVREYAELDELLTEVEQDVIAGAIADADSLTMRLSPLKDAERDVGDTFADRVAALERGLADGGRALAAAVDAAGHRRRDLAIEMEIVAGVDTIADDAQQRLALQVARLNQGMRTRGQLVEDPIEIARRFCSTGPAGAGAARLRDRFFRACEAALE
jgi:hypothetical protein